MRIPSGTTDQYIYFVAVDATDLKTRETGLTTFTVYRSRNGAAAAAMTTPTVTEVDATNMPGVYKLLADEDMSIATGNDSEEMVFHITHAGMAPVTRTIELYRRAVTAGETLSVGSSGEVTTLGNGAIAASSIAPDAIGASELAADAVAEIADAVWDEATSGHVTAGSFGEQFQAIRSNTAQAGASTSITLDTGASSTDGAYVGFVIHLIGGTGAGQAGIIYSYNGTSKVAAVLPFNANSGSVAWLTNPASDTRFVIMNYGTVNVDVWRAGGVDALVSGRVPSDVLAISGDATAANNLEAALDGTGGVTLTADIDGEVTSCALVDSLGVNALDANALASTAVDELVDAVWDELRSGHTTAGTFGETHAPTVSGTVETATTAPTTSSFAAADITEATADHYIGRIVIFITGALTGQATDITDYALTTGEGVFTVTTMTEAPADGDRFVIL